LKKGKKGANTTYNNHRAAHAQSRSMRPRRCVALVHWQQRELEKMKWQKFIQNLKPVDEEIKYQLRQPCDIKSLVAIETEFQIDLSDELKSLYQESDGILELLGDQEIGTLIWLAEYLIKENKSYRETADFKDLYMPFDSLLFFGDAGNGDCFGYSILNGAIQKLDVFTWNHEDDSRTWVAPNLEKFIEWWVEGKINV
jgi:hypothetical protein